MKKNISLLAIVFTITMLTACSNNNIGNTGKFTEEINLGEFEEEIDLEEIKDPNSSEVIDKNITCKTFVTHDYPVEEKIVEITTKEEWEKYKYKNSISLEETDNIFSDKKLYIIQSQSSTGSIKPYISEATINNNILYAIIGAKYPEIGTCDMAGVFYVFICDKAVDDIIINNNAHKLPDN